MTVSDRSDAQQVLLAWAHVAIPSHRGDHRCHTSPAICFATTKEPITGLTTGGGHPGRVDEDFRERAGWPRQAQPRIYVRGPTAFVEAATSALTENGQRPDTIRTERFGPTGG
jgi:ferredoxin-NADP reductase